MSDAQPRVEHDSIDRDCSDQQGMMSYTIFWKENPSVPLVRSSRSHPESGCILNRLPRNPQYFSVNSWMIVNMSYDRQLRSKTVVDFGSCEVFSMVFV